MMQPLSLPDSTRPLRGLWIPWIFVAGMLGVVCVNAVLIYFAFHSWAGAVTARPYERGLAYNQLIAAAAEDSALGWWANVAYHAGDDARAATLFVELRDAHGMPLSGAQLSVELLRPVEPVAPVAVTMMANGAGRYAGAIGGRLRRGQWDARIKVVRAGTVAHFTQRITVP